MNKKNIEAILPLTPLQQGFLWHSVADDLDLSAGLIQMQCRLNGRLEHSLFERAWQQTVECHQQLRASVHWRNVKQPVSVIHKQVLADVQHLDWRSLAADRESLEHFLTKDLNSGLQIEQAPVSRMTLIQTDENTHELIWTCHHLLLDGWSGGLVIDEIFRRYESLVYGTEFAPARYPAFASYSQWLQARELEPAREYWTNLLAGFEAPGGLSGVTSPIEHELSLGGAETSSLMTAVRESRTTLNAWLQFAWAVVLARISNCDDVVFGITASGRQIDLAGADHMIGMFINVLPVRVRVRQDCAASALLREVQAQSFNGLPHAFVDAPQIQAWSQCPGRLFDSLIVVENQPAGWSPKSIEINNRRSGIVSAYCVTVVAKPGDDLTLSLSTIGSLFTSEQSLMLLQSLRSILVKIAAAPDCLVGDLALDSLQTIVVPVVRSSLGNRSADASPVAVPIPLLEKRIQKIWENTLGVERITSSDSFFELGGTSILALVMVSRLEAEIGVRLPTTALLQHDTTASLAKLIQQDETANQWADVVAIQVDGDKPPLFIPDTATDLLIYRHLAKELGPSQPLYGFRARELGALPLAELAERLNEQLRALQPQGPYYLAGLSGGGPLAWLMAQQLEEQGCTVGLLVLFDCLGPAYPSLQSPVRRVLSCVRSAGRVLWRKVTQPDHDKLLVMAEPGSNQAAERTDTEADRLPSPFARGRSLVRTVTRGRSIGERAANLVVLATLKIPTQSNDLAWSTFMQGLWLEERNQGKTEHEEGLRFAGSLHSRLYDDLKPYRGRIEFFKASQRPPAILDDEFTGWRQLIAGEFVVHIVPGGHVTLIEPPHAAEVAQILAASLARCQSDN